MFFFAVPPRRAPLRRPSTPVSRAATARKKLLMKQAKNYLPYRLAYYAELYGYQYEKCRISCAKTRWGSCSSTLTISLNANLMEVPRELQDYVILHELAHLHHMNHSAAFWAEVATHDPDYKTHRRQLKQFSPKV